MMEEVGATIPHCKFRGTHSPQCMMNHPSCPDSLISRDLIPLFNVETVT